MSRSRAVGPGRPPRPPLAEPAFYVPDRDSADTFLRVVDGLLDRGATLAGTALLGDTGRPDELADLTEHSVDRVPVADRDGLARLAPESGRTLVRVTLTGVGAGSAGRAVDVRLLPIPADAVGIDRHPVALVCDGAAFEPHVSASARRRAGGELLELFTGVVADLLPAYAAALMEWPLPSPCAVAQRPDGFEFGDCYLSADYVGEATLRELRAAAGAANSRDLAGGALLLTGGLFGPAVPNADVGRLAARAIARHCRR